MECCGRDPTDIRNGFPSHVHRALHNLGKYHRFHHMHHRQYPLLLKCGSGIQASVHHGQGNMPLPERQVRFLRCKHFSDLHLPVSPDVQMLRSFRWNNRCLCCCDHIFRAPCYDSYLERKNRQQYSS